MLCVRIVVPEYGVLPCDDFVLDVYCRFLQWRQPVSIMFTAFFHDIVIRHNSVLSELPEVCQAIIITNNPLLMAHSLQCDMLYIDLLMEEHCCTLLELFGTFCGKVFHCSRFGKPCL